MLQLGQILHKLQINYLFQSQSSAQNESANKSPGTCPDTAATAKGLTRRHRRPHYRHPRHTTGQEGNPI
jgi:hypothetical protein